MSVYRPVDILLVDDDSGDILLTKKTLKDHPQINSLYSVQDGVEAMKYLRKEGPYAGVSTPDLILLDLNMPRMGGRETLAEIKSDDRLRMVPVVILTTSEADRDIESSYLLQASGFITKPVDLEQFAAALKMLAQYWIETVVLPPKQESDGRSDEGGEPQRLATRQACSETSS